MAVAVLVRLACGKTIRAGGRDVADVVIPAELAHELGWSVPRTEELLGLTHRHPVLRLVP